MLRHPSRAGALPTRLLLVALLRLRPAGLARLCLADLAGLRRSGLAGLRPAGLAGLRPAGLMRLRPVDLARLGRAELPARVPLAVLVRLCSIGLLAYFRRVARPRLGLVALLMRFRLAVLPVSRP